MNLIRKLAMAAALMAAATTTSMAYSLEWTAGPLSNNWSDNNNWVWIYGFPSWSVSAAPPGPADVISFEDQLFTIGFNPGWTNVPGAVNNIVDTNTAVGAANYTAVSVTGANHFYTTLISPGMTLTLGGLGAGNAALVVGDIPGYLPGYYTGTGTNGTTITGPGTLFVNEPTGLISVGMKNRATLDLSGLNTFNATVGSLWIAVRPDNVSTTPSGWVLLAQTNMITTSANPAAPGILLGSTTNGTATAVLNLGGTNSFNTDALVVGGLGTASGTTLAFGTNYIYANPLSTFTLRGSAGNTAVSTFSIGDLAADAYSFNAFPYGGSSSGAADFSGGTVDIWADSIYIGRSTLPGTNNFGSGVGTLIVENGTVTATNVFMNYKMPGTNATIGTTSKLILRSNATMNIVNDLYLGFRTNGASAPSGGGLFVSNSAVLNVGGSIRFTNVGSTWTTPPGITLADSGTIIMNAGGNVMVPGNLFGSGTISNANTITVSNGLSSHTNTVVGTLNLSSNLVLGSASTITFNLGANNTIGGGVNDYIKVGKNVTFNTNRINLTYNAPLVPGLYTLMSYGGTQSGFVTWTNPFRSPIGLVQSNGTVGIYVTNWTPTTLVWRGGTTGSTNWDVTSLVWNTNTDKFYQFDSVIFDDTGVATNVSITSITNIPGSITFTNNAKIYTFSQSSGMITGPTGLDKWGTNTLIWGGSVGHTFTGPVNINQGLVQLPSGGSPTAFGGTGATNALSIASGAMLDLFGVNLGSRPINLAGSGIGGLGAITTSRPNISTTTLTTRSVALTDNAAVGCTNANASLLIQGANFPYDYALDLRSNTLSTVGPVKISQFTVTNSGSINVGGPYLGLNNCIIDGPGTINLGANVLEFYTKSTTGYVAKAISVNGGSIQNFVADTSTNQIRSAITIANNGTLYITNGTPGGQTILLSGVISGTGSGLGKGGNSNLVLSAANTYTGPTEVGAGSLILVPGASLASSLIQVDSPSSGTMPASFDVTALSGGYTLPPGQSLTVNGFSAGDFSAGFGSTFSGFGTNLGNVTVAAGATLAPGGSLVEGTLTINSNLTFSGGSAIIKLDVVTNVVPGMNDLVAVGGNLSFTAPTTIQIVPVSALDTKPYALFTYGGTLSGTNNITLTSASPRYSFALDFSVPGVIRVVHTGNAGNLLWQGGAAGNPNTWDLATTTNWLNGASLDVFNTGDSVTFDNTATTTTVTMAGLMRPGFMTNNSTATYVLNGSGSVRAATLVANSGTFTFANTNNNLLSRDGIQLNGGNVTFNQFPNATVTAQLSSSSSSSGSLNKNGTNSLTWTSADSTGMSAPVNINAGTIRAVGTNVLGSGTITIASGATLDINGSYMSAGGAVHAQGIGADGQGALNNGGLAQTNGLNNLVLDGNTTLGAASNRWDIAPIDTNSTATLLGNNFNVVKTGGQDLWIRPLTDTGLGNIDVSAGRLIFAGANTTLGNTSSNIVVRTNAVLGFANGISDLGKNTLIQQGGQLYCGGFFTNEFDGAITLSNGLVKLERYGQLNLGGNLSGPATLQMQAFTLGFPVTLTLSGSNSYTGGTLVNEGTLALAGSYSLPGTNNAPGGTNNVTLTPGVNYQQFGWPALSLGSVVSPVGVRLVMSTTFAGTAAIAELDGNGGTWTGPIQISGSANNNCTVIIKGGTNGLTINGTVLATNLTANYLTGGVAFGGMILDPDVNDLALNGTGGGQANVTTLAGSAITFNSQLNLAGSLSCFNSQNLNGNFTKVVFNAPSNNWAGAYFRSGMIQIGVDNAIPQLSPFQVRNSIDRRFILDLNGHNQGLGAFDHDAANNSFYEVAAWFGNSSTSADSTLSYVGTGTNIWAAFIVDAFNTNAPIQHKTGLTVTSGYLWLTSTIYTNIPSITNQPIAIYTNHGVLQTNLNPFPAGPTPAPIASTYSGRTLVSGGVLQVDRNIPNSPVTVVGAGTLGGNGTLGGTVAIGSGGTLAPGPTIGNLTGNLTGTLVISNNLVFSNSSTCFMKTYPSSGTSDQVVGLSNIMYGGKLVITNLFNTPYTNAQVIKLFDATSYQGAFTTISVTDGSTYSNHLAADGAITILQAAASVNVAPCSMTVTKTASSITFSWPSDHTGWRLTTQTNPLASGVRQTNTWYTVPGSSTTNTMTVPIDKNQPSIIYRLTYP
jgi:autotransporter-associated beta strand protein